MKSKSLFVVMALLSAVGCGGKKKPDVAAQSADDPSQYKLVATTSAVRINNDNDKSFTEPRVYDRSNVGFHARGEANVLVISVRNKGDMDLTIYPQDFALITGPDRRRDLMVVNPVSADVSQFTNVTLRPNDRAVINLPIKLFSNLKGLRMVYNNPRQNIMCFVDVE